MFRKIEIWYVTVRWINIFLASIFVIVGRLHDGKQYNKLITFENIRTYNNPLPELRCWIILNLISQTINCVESTVFIAMPSIHCSYDP
jgi:hypothetical protein